MAYSPYNRTVYSPIKNLEEIKQDLRQYRALLEENPDFERIRVDGPDPAEELLKIGEKLAKQCKFLAAKLDIEKRENDKLFQEKEDSKKEAGALRVKLEMAAATAATTTEQLVPNDEKTEIEANSESVNSRNATERKRKKGEGSPGTVASPCKHALEIDPTMDGNGGKRKKM